MVIETQQLPTAAAEGQVIDLDVERAQRRGGADREGIHRLERAVARLEVALQGAGTLPPTLPQEIDAIERTVSAGRCEEATDRTLRLAALLEHPARGRR